MATKMLSKVFSSLYFLMAMKFIFVNAILNAEFSEYSAKQLEGTASNVESEFFTMKAPLSSKIYEEIKDASIDSSHTCVNAATAAASFVNGTLSSLGNLHVLDLTVDFKFLQTYFDEQCGNTIYSLQYHDHLDWVFGNGTVLNFHGECLRTGSSYDPGLACGAIGNSLCKKYNLPGSMALQGTPYFSGDYSCDPHLYKHFPFTCHVGDRSGKFGLLKKPTASLDKVRFIRILYDAYSANTCNSGFLFKSVTVHCDRGFPLFCWPWGQADRSYSGKKAFYRDLARKLMSLKADSLQEPTQTVDFYSNIKMQTLYNLIKKYFNGYVLNLE